MKIRRLLTESTIHRSKTSLTTFKHLHFCLKSYLASKLPYKYVFFSSFVTFCFTFKASCTLPFSGIRTLSFAFYKNKLI